MNSKLDEYNRGIFKYKNDKLIISTEEINEHISSGETYEGSIDITTKDNVFVKGIVYSSHEFVHIENNTFAGMSNRIRYTVSCTPEHQNNIQGNITIVSNCNEVIVPFIFTVEHPKFDSSIGEIRDLFQFANLAKTDVNEALEIFLSPRFEKVLINKDIKTELIYRSLIKSKNKYIALEEFLVAIRKKMPIVVELNKTNIEYELGNEEFKDSFTIKKKEWGYCEYEISSTAKYITFDKNVIKNDDFVSKKCKVAFYIHPAMMNTGKNESQIIIRSKTDKQVITVVCHSNRNREDTLEQINIQKNKYRFTKNYLDFRTGNINLDKYLKENEDIIKNLCASDNDPMDQLLKVHLYIASGQKERAVQLLEDFEEILNHTESVPPVLRCGYLYLKTLINEDKDFLRITTKTISNFYENMDDSWQILWMLFYLDKKYESNSSSKIKAIHEQYKKGCTSPIMYYEACTAYNKDYTLLRHLDGFEIQILNWGTKKDCISKELAVAFATLAMRLRDFDKLVYKSLAILYGKYEQKEILTAICTMLIKAQLVGTPYYKWYKLGVQEQLKITQLYESYMYSYAESSNEPLLEPLLLYFTYNSNLSDNKKAFLYASVIKNKDSNPNIYNAYKPQIKEFAMQQLKNHVINENLKVVYEDQLTSDIVDTNIAKDLPYIMFKYDISCYRKEYVGAVVVHKALELEQYVKFYNGKAQINIFTESAEIFLVDEDGNRYVRNNFYTLKKLFNITPLIDKCYEFNQTDGMLILYMQDKIDNYYRNDIPGKIVKKEVIRVPHLSAEYKKKYLYDLINYTYENNELDLLDKYLDMIDIEGMSPKEKSYIIEYMIIRGFKKKALEAIITYGYSNIPVIRLEKLATTTVQVLLEQQRLDEEAKAQSRLTTVSEQESLEKYEDLIIGICSYVFENGKSNETILGFLSDKYASSTMNMYNLWKACTNYENIDTVVLEENILAQLLFSQSFIPNSFELFISYYKHYTSKKVVKAYLMYNSYKYVVKGRILDEDFFEVIKRELELGKNDLFNMALLKFYSEKDNLTNEERDYVQKNVEYFVRENIILPFFLDFRDEIYLPEYIADKYYVQYITDPESKVLIHYCLDDEDSDETKFTAEVMRDVFYGIRVKEFILFYEDDLQYYIAEDEDGEVNITESNNILVDSCDTEDESRYNKINLMLMTRDMNDEKTLINTMKSMIITDYMAQKMFKPL